jgi:hypothetical protein
MTRSTILGGGTVVMVVSQDEAWEAGSSSLASCRGRLAMRLRTQAGADGSKRSSFLDFFYITSHQALR